jgi:23S rRNA (cytosine1962-C5)-methyltransferase
MLLTASGWDDYELLDSGNGLKLERFGPYRLVRPEAEAIWKPALSKRDWDRADGVFTPTSEEHGGHWEQGEKLPARWAVEYKGLRLWLQTSASRHLGIFPEQTSHWDWIGEQVKIAGRPLQVLNLFGYTGAASLAAARYGAQVTHVDASKKAVQWARDNQLLSNLAERNVRWLVDDALKFVQREARRGARYDGLIFDPPKFGRGPKGEVWEFYKLLPNLLHDCRAVLTDNPQFVVFTAYAVKASALTLYYAMREMMGGIKGFTSGGELVIEEKSAGRLLSTAVFARWEAPPPRRS